MDQCLEPVDDAEAPADVNDLYSSYCCFLEVMGQRNPLAFNTFKGRLKNILPHLFRERSGGGKSKNRQPATFFGFRIREGLWSRTMTGFSPSDTVSTRSGEHGYLRRSALLEGHLALLEDHDPASSNSMTAVSS